MCQTIITECKCLLLQRLNLIIHFASKPNLPISPHQKALLASNRFCYPLCFLLCHFAEL